MRVLLSVGAISLGFVLGCIRFDRGEVGIVGVDVDSSSPGVSVDDSLADDSSEPVSGVCPEYTGFYGASTRSSWRTRAEWEAENNASGTFAWTVTEWVESGDEATFTVEIAGVNALEGYDYYNTRVVSRYRCDPDGLWLLSNRVGYEYSYGGQANSGWSEVVYVEPMLSVRAALEVGARWSGEGTMQVTTSQGTAYDQSYTYGFEVVSAPSVTVPAGEFQTLKLVSTEYESESWLDAEVGAVRTLSTELVDWTR